MKNGFELYTNNAGGITLYIIQGEKPVAAFCELELLLNYRNGGETLRSMIGELVADPNAYETWDGAWDDTGCTVVDLYSFDADPERDHDISTLNLEGEYDTRWRCTVTVHASASSSVCELLGWTKNE